MVGLGRGVFSKRMRFFFSLDMSNGNLCECDGRSYKVLSYAAATQAGSADIRPCSDVTYDDGCSSHSGQSANSATGQSGGGSGAGQIQVNVNMLAFNLVAAIIKLTKSN